MPSGGASWSQPVCFLTSGIGNSLTRLGCRRHGSVAGAGSTETAFHGRGNDLCLNSARVELGRPLSQELLEPAILIVDECHRAGAPENRRIFEVPRRSALGLSATPERDFEEASAGKPSGGVPDVILGELGPVVYELTFREALKQRIVPPFELIHVAVDLTPRERRQYDKLTRELSDLRDRIRRAPAYVKGRTRVANEFQLIKSLSRQEKSKIGKLAARYGALTNRRKELLYRASNRRRCFESILKEERDTGDVRIIAFHDDFGDERSVRAPRSKGDACRG